ncbi:MAG: type II toxin-antitoxin system Phd/YefM family antitoxin [Sporichthyaceae bacterium]
MEMTVSAARSSLPRVLELVENGEEVTLTRHGRPVAVVIRPDLLRARRLKDAMAGAQQVADLLERGRSIAIDMDGGIPAGRAEELVRQIREDRDAR